MALNNIDGSVVALSISTDLTTPVWKEMVCAEGTQLSGTRETNKRKTKCGPIVSVGEPEWVISGSGAANKTPGANQISSTGMLDIFQNSADILVKVATADGTYIRQGQGKLSSYSETMDEGDSVSFEFQIDLSGNITTA